MLSANKQIRITTGSLGRKQVLTKTAIRTPKIVCCSASHDKHENVQNQNENENEDESLNEKPSLHERVLSEKRRLEKTRTEHLGNIMDSLKKIREGEMEYVRELLAEKKKAWQKITDKSSE